MGLIFWTVVGIFFVVASSLVSKIGEYNSYNRQIRLMERDWDLVSDWEREFNLEQIEVYNRNKEELKGSIYLRLSILGFMGIAFWIAPTII